MEAILQPIQYTSAPRNICIPIEHYTCEQRIKIRELFTATTRILNLSRKRK